MTKRTKMTILLLLLISVCVYISQLCIFHDPHNTFFYILQDLAFLPFTIAIATIVVGEVMDARERAERLQKTRMLASTFFTELGTAMLREMLQSVEMDPAIRELLGEEILDAAFPAAELSEHIEKAHMKVAVTKEFYESMKNLILSRQTSLLIISSNPLLLEHESFTGMLWSIFHLVDEFRLRGEYDELSQTDILHFQADFTATLELLLVNWSSNVRYMKTTYPNFFSAARSKLEQESAGLTHKSK